MDYRGTLEFRIRYTGTIIRAHVLYEVRVQPDLSFLLHAVAVLRDGMAGAVYTIWPVPE
jgi:hypothetical protein